MIKKKPSCPQCKEVTKTYHCTSPTCDWYICRKCVSSGILGVVIDARYNRHFLVRK